LASHLISVHQLVSFFTAECGFFDSANNSYNLTYIYSSKEIQKQTENKYIQIKTPEPTK